MRSSKSKSLNTKSNEIPFLCCYFCPLLQSFVPYCSYASATKQENNTLLFDLSILNYFAGFSCCKATWHELLTSLQQPKCQMGKFYLLEKKLRDCKNCQNYLCYSKATLETPTLKNLVAFNKSLLVASTYQTQINNPEVPSIRFILEMTRCCSRQYMHTCSSQVKDFQSWLMAKP